MNIFDVNDHPNISEDRPISEGKKLTILNFVYSLRKLADWPLNQTIIQSTLVQIACLNLSGVSHAPPVQSLILTHAV